MKKRLSLMAALALLVPTMASAGERIKLRNAQTGAEYGPVEVVAGARLKVGEATLVVETLSQTPAQAALEKKLKSIIIPDMNFSEAAIPAAIDFYKVQARKLDSEKKGVNIILAPRSAPNGPLPNLSLQITNVSLYDALRYSCEATGLRMRIDDNAIVLSP